MLRIEMGLDQPAFGKLFGKKKQSVSAWETGKATPQRPTLARIAEKASEVLKRHVSVDWILTGRETQSASAIPYAGRGRLIPKMGTTEQTETVARHRTRSAELVQTYFHCSSAAFSLQVVGPSMEPDFHEGDIIVIDPAVSPEPGDFVWAEIKTAIKGERRWVFRRYRPKSFCRGKPKVVELLPVNEDWPRDTIDLKTDGRIIGTLVESARQWARR